uniref:Ganglioside GM2 activator n=1 Tax=Latimeria chalumnae TaxID=7897 RepID=H3BD97_LATCH
CGNRKSWPIFVSMFLQFLYVKSSGNSGAARVLTQVGTFAWSNCGTAQEPASIHSLSVQPDPIAIPGDLKVSAAAAASVALTSPLMANLTLHREVAGVWVKIPCIEEIGSCVYDVCSLLDEVIPPGQPCPEPLHTYGIPCHCPFKAGDYSMPESNFFLPSLDLPYWLTSGNYKLVALLSHVGKELACAKFSFSIRESKSTQKNFIPNGRNF